MTQADTPAADTFDVPPPPFQGARLAVVAVCLTLLILPGMWLARMAAREVSQYHASTYEVYAREALALGRPQDALKYCAGALRATLARNDHWGTAHLLRAQAYHDLGDMPNTLAELNAAATFWANKYYFATDEDRAEIQRFAGDVAAQWLAEGRGEEALAAYSAAGLGGGDVVGYLYDLADQLDAGQQSALWPEGRPFLLARRFGKADLDEVIAVAEEQGRTLRASGLDPTLMRNGLPSLLIDVTESQGEGRSWYGLPAYIRLSERPFGVRVVTRSEAGGPYTAVLGFWFETAQRSANTGETTHDVDPDSGWRRHTVSRDFYADQLQRADADGYLVSDGIVNRVMLELAPGPAGRYWVNAVEVFIPAN